MFQDAVYWHLKKSFCNFNDLELSGILDLVDYLGLLNLPDQLQFLDLVDSSDFLTSQKSKTSLTSENSPAQWLQNNIVSSFLGLSNCNVVSKRLQFCLKQGQNNFKLSPDVGLRRTCAYYCTSAYAMCMRKCVQKGFGTVRCRCVCWHILSCDFAITLFHLFTSDFNTFFETPFLQQYSELYYLSVSL